MAKSKEEKTNVMRTLEQKKLPYTAHSYDPDGPIDGVSVAQTLGQPLRVFGNLRQPHEFAKAPACGGARHPEIRRGLRQRIHFNTHS